MNKTDYPFIEIEKVRPARLREVIARRPIAYIPVGALEWHGEHCALGLDGIKARYICEGAAKISGGVLFPTIYYGAFNTMRFNFTLHHNKRHFKKQIRSTLDSLADWGFKSIVLLSGHYPMAMVSLLRTQCRRVSKKKNVAAVGIAETALAHDLGYFGDHAAKWETSLLMAIDPQLVDLAQLPPDTGSLGHRAVEHGIYGICPVENADAELGARTLATIIERLADVAAAMLVEGNGPAERVYKEYKKAFADPWQAGRTAYGVQSRWEIFRFTLAQIIRQRHL